LVVLDELAIRRVIVKEQVLQAIQCFPDGSAMG
jgi:hypothetical protein